MRVDRLAVGCAVAAVLVVLAAAAEGLTTPSGRRSAPPDAVLPTPTPTATPPPPLDVLPEPPAQELPGALVSALVVVVAAVVVALLVAVVLLLRRAWQRRRRRPDRLEAPDETAGTAGVVEAPVVRRGIARSLEVLDEARGTGDVDDAVVRAWLGLEETAEDAGLARAPAETPTEFTTRLLSRVPADREAVDVLRSLYSRARFGVRTPGGSGTGVGGEDDAERARAALRALARSWEAPRA